MTMQVPNPGVGGSYLFDPETGDLKLISSTTAQQQNGTDTQKVLDRKDRVNVRNGSESSGRKRRDPSNQS